MGSGVSRDCKKKKEWMNESKFVLKRIKGNLNFFFTTKLIKLDLEKNSLVVDKIFELDMSLNVLLFYCNSTINV